MIQFLSVCSGLEGASLAVAPLGWTAVGFAEIEAFPAAILAERYGSNLPGEPLSRNAPPNFGDFTAIDVAALGDVDILIGGTPCFTAGTLILAKRGLIPIEDIRQGDEVWTHQNRWRRVLNTMRRQGETMVLKGQGHFGLETTADHPFWARAKWSKNTRVNGKSVRLTGHRAGDWTDAKDMAGVFWASPGELTGTSIPSFEVRAYEGRNLPNGFDADFFWIVGAWLGDGWLRTDQRSDRPDGQTNGYVLICGNKKHEAEIAGRLERAGLAYSTSQERTTVRFQISSKPLARWIDDSFGRGCEGKKIPSWLFGAPADVRMAFLDGYLFADGSQSLQPKGGGLVQKITTINRGLAIGVRMLAATVGLGASIVRNAPKRDLTIEGRSVSEKPFFQVSIYKNSRSAFVADGLMWGKVRSSVSTGRCAEVFNFEVDEDNSYVADGFIVHNCQAFSIAGKRLSLADARGNLTLAYAVLAHELARSHGLKNALWENVPGVLNTPDNAFGCFLGSLVGADDALLPVGKPRAGKSNAFWRWRKAGTEVDDDGNEIAVEEGHVTRWPHAGMVAGPLGRAAWRLLDAQYFGLAQRRRRVFVVADFGNGADPAAVLFEPLGMRGNSAPSREAREAIARPLAAGTRSSGGYRNDADTAENLIARPVLSGGHSNNPLDENLIAHALRGEGFDASEDGTGRGTPIVPVAYRTSPNCGAWETGDRIDALTTGTDATAHVLASMGHAAGHPDAGAQAAVAFDLRGREFGAQFEGPHDTVNIRAANGGSSRSYVAQASATQWAVRRLTPRECERLQGVPDNYTRIPWRGRPADQCPDGPRYKSLGNSWAVPVVRWIGERIDQQLRQISQSPSAGAQTRSFQASDERPHEPSES